MKKNIMIFAMLLTISHQVDATFKRRDEKEEDYLERCKRNERYRAQEIACQELLERYEYGERIKAREALKAELKAELEKIGSCQECKIKRPTFFDGLENQKSFEPFEHMGPEILTFFLSSGHPDHKEYGEKIFARARGFVSALQAAMAPLIQSDQPVNAYDLYKMSKHAITQCNQCATVELKRRQKKELGMVLAKDPLLIRTPMTEVDARAFYDNACGDIYKNLSDERLAQILEVTK